MPKNTKKSESEVSVSASSHTEEKVDKKKEKNEKSEKKDKKDKKNKKDKHDTTDKPKDDKAGITEELKKKFLKFTECDYKIKDLQKQIKELKMVKDECQEYILDEWDDLDIDVIEVKGSKIFKDKRESKGPCKPEIIKDTLEKELKDSKLAKILMEKMDNKREVKETVSLKITNEKPPKKKKAAKE